MQTNKLIKSGNSGLNVAPGAQIRPLFQEALASVVLNPDSTLKHLGSFENYTIQAPRKFYYIRISGGEAGHQSHPR